MNELLESLARPVITQGLTEATLQTLWMVGLSGLVSVLLGLPLGVLLHASSPGGLRPMPRTNRVVGAVVNVTRSLPFIILMVALIPVTRLITGTSVGSTAAAVPLAIGAIPFFARLVEAALRDVDPGTVEAAEVIGSTRRQVVTKVLLPEATPGLVAATTTTLITLVAYSAMAGAVGGGGLGFLAISYGYRRFDTVVMVLTVVVLVVMVQLLQALGDHLARRLDHR
ncbi:methionine ABC transporter permease [Aquipuribacter sp. MA13-6]|uniref:methionine ABC transporter permease n=1 Tax=unclassified Aquipuribacter TaxID=2635084 RepID=UPI003EEE9980